MDKNNNADAHHKQHGSLIQTFSKITVAFTVALLLSSCQTGQIAADANAQTVDGAKAPSADKRTQRIAELQVVDCSLPGQMRFLGNSSYLTPRRPTRTTAADCKLRGGEFVAYDRADYKTALAVWMPSAESGDAEAQANVGEIFERGLGGEANYQAALIWYQKAAEQGNKRAQFNLGTLYEQGLGVDKDMAAAMNWYRKAWGLPADDLVYKSYMDKEIANSQQQLAAEIEKKDKQIKLLESQIRTLQKSTSANAEMKQQIGDLQNLVQELKQDKNKSEIKIAENKGAEIRLRQPNASSTEPAIVAPIKTKSGDFGRYFALVIGDQAYQKIDPLQTPLSDTSAVANVLEKKYGFAVTQLQDADNITIMEAINNLNSVLTENDNLLIYYAGHGSRVKGGTYETGYWLPVNADPPPRDTFWISNEFVTRHLALLKAKRVLVVADSCYAGMLSNEPGFLLLGNNQKPSDEYIRYKLERRSRLLLTSGGDNPVLDSGGGRNSVFAKAFVDVLQNNDHLLTGPEIFQQVKTQVMKSAQQVNFKQEPAYKTIKEAGHEVGDFFFVPKSVAQN